MSLLARIRMLEIRYKPVDLEKEKMEKALSALSDVLRSALPCDEPRRVQSTIYSHAINLDYRGCLSFNEQLNHLARNIENGTIKKCDQEVIDALPQWALAVVEMTAVEYVGMCNDILSSC